MTTTSAQKVLAYDVEPYLSKIKQARKELETAQKNTNEAVTKYIEAVALLTGVPVDQLHTSHYACITRFIPAHMFDMRDPKPKCVFCGCARGTSVPY